MFKLNLKIAWRNLLKHKGYAAVNIIGLALGLAGFIFIVLFVNHEKSYDTWNPALKNVYQLQEFSDYYSTDKKAHWRSEIDQRLARIKTAVPQITAVTMVNLEYRKHGVTVPGKPSILQSGMRRSDSLFFKVMPYEFKYGDADLAFLHPNSVVLKENLALKYFGNVNPVGKTITIAGGSWRGSEDVFTVTGVVKELSTPSSVNFEAIYFEDNRFFDISGDHGDPSEIYVKTSGINNVVEFNQTLQRAYLPIKDQFLAQDKKSLIQARKEGNFPQLKLTQLNEVHQAPLEQESWKATLKPVILLSILLLIVSIINFINLATAQAASRAKEIGIKKVVGAFRRSLVFQFLTETFLQCVFAMFIALLLIEITLPTLNSYFNLSLHLFAAPNIWLLFVQLLAIVMIVGCLTGFYPALFLSSYKPHEVLKGNFSNGKNNAFIKKGLVAVQFVVSVSVIIGILVVNYQLKFLKERDNGFTATGLINIKADLRYKTYYNRLKAIDGVQAVGYSSGVIGDNMASVQTFKYKNEKKDFLAEGVSVDGLKALDARLLAGRFFSEAVVRDTINNVIINESAAKMLGKNVVGQTLMANDTVAVQIVGVIKDLQVEGFEKAVGPSIYHVQTNSGYKGLNSSTKPTTLVRYDRSKTKNVIAGIEKIATELNEFYPASYTFVADDLSAVLISHERFERMVALFSILSLTLSLFGLFALAAFITKQRTKEIAVRKVLGAENTDILVLLNKGYLWIVLIANMIAFPLTYILINKWLATFAYRITISPYPFIIAFIASMLITIITVSLQAGRAVRANPVRALKYE